jgi:hypothetical protein
MLTIVKTRIRRISYLEQLGRRDGNGEKSGEVGECGELAREELELLFVDL